MALGMKKSKKLEERLTEEKKLEALVMLEKAADKPGVRPVFRLKIANSADNPTGKPLVFRNGQFPWVVHSTSKKASRQSWQVHPLAIVWHRTSRWRRPRKKLPLVH
jgi:hypothetical protein